MAKGRKTGGRKPGVPNKPNPDKELLRRAVGAHSARYYSEPLGKSKTMEILGGEDGGDDIPETGLTRFECDLALMRPAERAAVMGRLLDKNVPDLKSVDASLTTETPITIEARLRELCLDDSE